MGSVNIPVSSLMERYRERLTRGLADAGEVVTTEVRRTIREAKTGEHWPGLPNRSSAPGESPAYQFGGLDAGLVTDANENRATVTSYAPYSKRLEYSFFGTDSLGRVYHQEARPFMRPSLVVKFEEIKSVIAGAINGK